MSQIQVKEDLYAAPKPATVRAVVSVVAVVAAAAALLSIMGSPLAAVVAVAVAGVLLAAVVGVAIHRRWMKTTARPAMMRQAIALAVGQPLPDRLPGQKKRTIQAGKYAKGTILRPGPAQRIVLEARPLALLAPSQLADAAKMLQRCEGIEYTVTAMKTRRNVGGKWLFQAKEQQEKAPLTPREQVQERFTAAAKEVLGERATVSYVWDEKAEDYLVSADVTGFSGLDISLPGKQRQAAIRLSSQLPGAFKYKAEPGEDRLSFYRSRPLPAMVMPPAVHAAPLRSHEDYERFQVPLGIGAEGKSAAWDLVRDVHLLIIGGTGGGKTICEHGVIQQCTQACCRVWLVDGKMVELLGYEDWPNVEFLAQDVDEQIRLLHLAHETMWARNRLVKAREVRAQQLDPIVLVIDEVTSLLESVEQRYEDMKTKGMPSRNRVLKWLANIGRLGRSAKVHLVCGLQRPDATILSGEFRDNFFARISLGRLQSKEGSLMMWNNPAIGCQLPAIKGRAVSYIDGEPGQVQATFNANPDREHKDYHEGLVEAMRPHIEVYTRKRILPPTPTIPEKKDEEAKVTWNDILEAKIVDAEGKEVVFDPVSSEESRLLRTQASGEGVLGARELQAADSREEAMALFPPPSAQQKAAALEYGSSLVQAMIRSLSDDGLDARPAAPSLGPAGPVAMDMQAPPMTAAHEVSVAELEEGQYVLFEELGEEIMVSDIDSDDGQTFVVTGYTEDGSEEAVSADAGTTVQVREAYAEDYA